EIAPKDPEPRRSLASLYISQGKKAETETFLQQVKKDFPNNSVGYRMLGDYFFSSNQADKALTEYASLYRDHPQDITVKNNYIQLLILNNQLEQAKKLNDEVLKVTPNEPTALICKGQIELRSGQANNAVNTLQSV